MSFDLATALPVLLYFALGAVVGSFLNVCVHRMPRGESPAGRPSHCPACDHRLRIWPDMVPILSQLFFRSRCRYCGQRFSWRYLWVEAITGVCFVLVGLRFGDNVWELVPTLVFVAALLAVAFIDLEHFVIPDQLIWVAIAAGIFKDVALMAQGDPNHPLWHQVPGTPVSLPVPTSVLSAAVSGWLLWQLAAVASAAVKQEAMGGGDTFLLVAMGANLPLSMVGMAFFLAVGLGAIGGVLQLALTEWWSSRSRVPVPRQSEGNGGPALTGGVSVETEPVMLPTDSRLGRVLTVLGTWVVVLGSWWIIDRWTEHQKSIAISVGLLAATAAVALLRIGTRLWKRGDAVWAPQADAAFEEGPGPRMIPFGPYLVAGTLLAMFFGQNIIDAYTGWLRYAAGAA